MPRFLLPAVLLLLFYSQTTMVGGWGYSVHEEVVAQATDNLPENWKSFLQEHLKEIREASVFPDQNKENDPTEGPRHYDDSDIPHQDINVSSTSENYSLGVVSWAALNTTNRLVTAIREGKGNEVVFQMGVLSHYLSDASQPFHATSNFDGQKTGNDGIHSRFETILPTKYWDKLWDRIEVSSPEFIPDIYNATKDAIKSGLEIVPALLDADDVASASEDYWATFYNLTADILVERLVLSVQLTLNAWYSAIISADALDKDLSTFSFTTKTLKSPPVSTSSQNSTAFPWLIIVVSFSIMGRKSMKKNG